MRKWLGLGIWLVVLAAASACARQQAGGPAPALPGAATGAASAQAAVETFMDAVKAQDLQTLGAVWGTTRGPARDQMNREELEKRLIVIQCKLDHDRWQFVSDRPALSAGGRQTFRIQLSYRQVTGQTTATTVRAEDGRWYVEDIDLVPLADFCR